MPDESVVQLRRNPGKQTNSRPHLVRHGKGAKGSSTLLSKGSGNLRRNLSSSLPRSQSSISLNQQHRLQPAHGNVDAGADASGDHENTAVPRNQSLARLSKGRAPHPIGAGGFGHRHRGLSSGLGNLAQSHKKSVIQLERDDDDDEVDKDRADSDTTDFEDTDAEEEETLQRPPGPPRMDSQLSIGIQKVEPTPPKISEETVISVSSLAEMASALKGARNKSGFVDDKDLISTAVNRSKNLGDMAQIVHGWNTNKGPNRQLQHQRSWSTTGLSESGRIGAERDSVPGDEDPREFEKVFREYTNARAISNPVISSLCRISAAQDSAASQRNDGGSSASSLASSVDAGASVGQSPHSLQLPSVKKVNSLVATTANQMSEFPDRNSGFSYGAPQSHGAIESVSTYTLNKIWQQGWTDPNVPHGKGRSPSAPEGIQRQASRVQQQLSNTRDKSQRGNSSIKLS